MSDLGDKCGSCVLAAKEDGGNGHCPRTASYPSLRLLNAHDCPLWKRRPQKRTAPPPPQTGSLF